MLFQLFKSYNDYEMKFLSLVLSIPGHFSSRTAEMRDIIPPRVEAMKKSGQEALNEVISMLEQKFRD
jgi:homoserine kinase